MQTIFVSIKACSPIFDAIEVILLVFFLILLFLSLFGLLDCITWLVFQSTVNINKSWAVETSYVHQILLGAATSLWVWLINCVRRSQKCKKRIPKTIMQLPNFVAIFVPNLKIWSLEREKCVRFCKRCNQFFLTFLLIFVKLKFSSLEWKYFPDSPKLGVTILRTPWTISNRHFPKKQCYFLYGKECLRNFTLPLSPLGSCLGANLEYQKNHTYAQ